MLVLNPKVDNYFSQGCGRCPLGGTLKCKVHLWVQELETLRGLLLNSGLTEELKWGVPCYTYKGKNIAIIGAFKEWCVISFMKGTLIDDPKGLLMLPGEYSQAGRIIRFKNISQILEIENDILLFLKQAIEVEEKGLKPKIDKATSTPMPSEFLEFLENDTALADAFNSLTPGRQRSYLLHFASAKQSSTRISRIEKNIPKILVGKGFLE